MVWPPPVLPTDRTNADPQQDTHPSDHNSLALAINDTVGEIRIGVARGRLAGTFLPADINVQAAAVQICTTPFTTTSTRWIKITAQFYFVQLQVPSPAASAYIIVDGVTYTRLIIGVAALNVGYICPGTAYMQLPAGAHTALLQCATSDGTMNINRGNPAVQVFLQVEDCGP